MTDNIFNSAAWSQGAEEMDAAREAWDTATFAAHQTAPPTGVVLRTSKSPVDEHVASWVYTLGDSWYGLIGNLSEAIGSDASKMKATAELYSDTESEAIAANNRFWGRRG